FFFTDPAPPLISPLSLHDALPISRLEPISVRALSRASDLPVPIVAAICGELRRVGLVSETRPVQFTLEGRRRFGTGGAAIEAVRSEEHTSELQSQSNLVCRLLLEK